jgi:tRNA A-37 threonylcarbamoyl transferase component Bud32/tetratricopeptide (TPR) repeat protein
MNSSCPTPDKLRHMLDDTLPDDDRRAIEPHVETCQSCCDALDEITRGAGLPAFGAALLAGLDSGRVGDAQASPRYRFVRYHKGGGSADVFEFWDEQLQRAVALKLLRDPHHADPERRRRFLNEAQVTARLAHPGIVPVYALAQTSNGETGCVMALVQGKTLAEAIGELHNAGSLPSSSDEARNALRPLLTRFIALCNTVAYAHSRKVLHRDIKPGNVILGVFGETVLIDWGLSRRFDEDEASRDDAVETTAGASASEVLMSEARGTFGFMSPEQTAQGSQVGPASDIYSLGATLFYLLTGEAPFPYPTSPREVETIIHRIRSGDFPPPTKVNPNVHPDLTAVCLKAMALQPGDRYSEASALATDVDRWLAGEPISARREPWLQRSWRWVKRHRVVTAAIAAAVLAALVASAVAAPFLQAAYTREKAERTLAEAQQARANSNEKETLLVLDSFLIKARGDARATAEARAELRNYYLPGLIHFYEKIILANQDDRSPEARQVVGRVYHGLGVCRTLTGDRRQAESHFLSAQAIQDRLTVEMTDPDRRVMYAADLAVTRIDLADLYKGLGREQDEATVRQRISVAYDGFLDRKDAYKFAVRVAQRFQDLGRFQESLSWQSKKIDALEELLGEDSDQTDVRNDLAKLVYVRAMCWYQQERFDLALKDWERRSQLTAAPLPPNVRAYRALSLAHRGDYHLAAAEAEALANIPGLDAESLYNLAGTLVISVSAARQDRRLPQNERDCRAERYAKNAVTCLRKSHSAGYFQPPGVIEEFKKDAAFAPLRNREDFKQFLSELERKK